MGIVKHPLSRRKLLTFTLALAGTGAAGAGGLAAFLDSRDDTDGPGEVVLEPGELPEPGLVRELDEELGILVEQSDLVPLTFVSHSYPDFHLLMPLFLCRGWQGEVHPHEGQEFAWVTPDELSRFEMPPADEPLKLLLPRLL